MNIQNIVALASQLKGLGFDEMGYLLLKRICFKPESFCITSRITREKDQVSFEIYFERSKKDNSYLLNFYDAVLQKEVPLIQAEIAGIDIAGLEQRMSDINWKVAFDINERKQFTAENKASWENEIAIESIIDELEKLDSTEDGKPISNNLKLKYWANIPDVETIVPFNVGKNRQEISQRFYLFEGQAGISVDEAYRFLQNRWLEKQMQIKRKQTDKTETEENGDQASSGNGLLKKKRISKPKGAKRNKAIQN